MNPTEIPPSLPPERDPPPRRRFPWLWFFGTLLGPVVLTSLSAFAGSKSGDLAPETAFVGGLLGGIAAGVILGYHIGRTSAARVGFSILFAPIFAVVCVTMSAFGCLATGYKLQF